MRWTDEYIKERIIASNQADDAPDSISFYSALLLMAEIRDELQAQIDKAVDDLHKVLKQNAAEMWKYIDARNTLVAQCDELQAGITRLQYLVKMQAMEIEALGVEDTVEEVKR